MSGSDQIGGAEVRKLWAAARVDSAKFRAKNPEAYRRLVAKFAMEFAAGNGTSIADMLAQFDQQGNPPGAGAAE